jgi:hypothetical protein
VEYLLCNCRALSSNHSPTKEKRGKEKEKKEGKEGGRDQQREGKRGKRKEPQRKLRDQSIKAFRKGHKFKLKNWAIMT